MCFVAFTNLEVANDAEAVAREGRGGRETLSYKQTLDTVISWGLDRFEEAHGDAKIKRANKEPLTSLT
eukprot:79410-Alexandrium_andersonii.AAC.1